MQKIEQTDCEHSIETNVIEKKYSNETFEKAADIFRVLGYGERLKILALLAEQELCVTEIAEISNEEISTVSQRLKVLRQEKIIKQRREGKHIYYKLADQHIIGLINNVLHHAQE